MGNAEILRGGYDAFARGDFPGVLAVLDPDIEFSVPEGAPEEYSGNHRGHDGVAGGVLGKIFTVWSSFVVKTDRFLEVGDRVVVLGRYEVIPRGGYTRSAIPFAHIWEMRDGRGVRFRGHSDTALVRDVRAAVDDY
jgi:ketosteroid isomerase-like protein